MAIQTNGAVRVFDTGEHRIGGVQQHQGGGAGSVTFTSQLGTFDVSSLRELGAEQVAATPAAAPAARHRAAPTSAPAQPSGGSTDIAAIIAAIESLAGLHQRGILSDDEFAAKKADLLGRL